METHTRPILCDSARSAAQAGARDGNQLLSDAERVRQHVLVEGIAGVVEQTAVAQAGRKLDENGLESELR